MRTHRDSTRTDALVNAGPVGSYDPNSQPLPMRTYADVDHAFAYFNNALFGGRLPPCLITFQRTRRSYGYFSGNRFVNVSDNNEITDEISLNPIYFQREMPRKILATLVHEMVHLEQQHFGNPGRGRYHNCEFAVLMNRVGLIASDTGEEGGRSSGEHMSHYVSPGGAFDRASDFYLAHHSAVFFQDRAYHVIQTGENSSGGGISGEGPDREGVDVDRAVRERERKAASKTRFYCPTPKCTVAWAKRGSEFICAKCEQGMLPGRRP
jgi:hypothetical protein